MRSDAVYFRLLSIRWNVLTKRIKNFFQGLHRFGNSPFYVSFPTMPKPRVKPRFRMKYDAFGSAVLNRPQWAVYDYHGNFIRIISQPYINGQTLYYKQLGL